MRIEGVVSLPLNGKKRYWLALEHLLSESLQVRYSLSKEVGIQGLLEYLHKEDVAYVVLRFFDSLPELHREGGDLDILISDHDEEKVRAFLQEHPGTIGVDVRTPSRSAPNSVTYYPPPIAREIIESAIDGPARSKIPAPREAFLSFAYHIVYHKGLSAGVPTDISGLTTNPHPENDYKGTVEALARNAGIVIDATMELLDEYLKSEGWQPKPETLIKIAPWNKWVRERFFAAHQGEEIGLSVFILKKKASERGIVDAIIERIQEEKGFKVIAKHVFTERETRYVARHLRGGVWDDHSGAVSDFLPGVAVVVVDMEMLTYAKMGVRQKNAEERVRKLKRTLRSMFDTDEVSLIHATDHTHEAYDYITHCFPREKDTIRDDIRILQDSVVLSRFQKVQARLRSIPFMIRMNLKRARQKILGTIVRWVME